MSLLTLEQVQSRPAVRFPRGNRIIFYMDFASWRGVPSDRDFYVVGDAAHDSLKLVADGYGLKDRYGNGCIIVARNEVYPSDVGSAGRTDS